MRFFTTTRRLVALGMATALAAGCVGPTTLHQVQVTEPLPAILGAELYLPKGPGPFPALVLLHGCSGIRPNALAWARWLQGEGYAALVLDSFGGRGLTTICGDSSPLTGARRAPDVFAAARVTRPVRITEARRGEGATVAYDSRAHGDSEKQLREFLRRHFGR